MGVLGWITLLPLFGAGLVMLVPRDEEAIHRGLGLLYATSGQPELARDALSTAMAMYQSMDMTFWLPQTDIALAHVETR